ncbi:MAG: PDZ domain-containing protein [Phycisphaeraceae bacterium]
MKNAFSMTSLLCAVLLASPALGQAEEATERERQLDKQIEKAVEELFEDLELRIEADDDLDAAKQLIEQRRRVEEIHRRVLEVQFDGRGELFDQGRAAEPVQLDAKVLVNPWVERPRDEVVAGLDHEDFTVRESAEAFLLTDDTLSKALLVEMIRQAKAPEQRHRLLRIAEHHVLREMRERDFGPQKQQAGDDEIVPGQIQRRAASVGYSYEPVLAHENPHANLPGVRVIATMPGFPGHAHLRRGDIIVQINGQGLSNHHREHDITNWVRWQIASRQAGDTINFTLLRDGKLFAVDMVCAEGQALDHMYTTDAFESAARKGPYQRAWEDAYETLVAEMPKPKTLMPVELGAD